MPSHTRVSCDQLARMIGTPDCPVLIDVCIDEDFGADPRLVPGAFRHPFYRIRDLAPRLADREVIVICQKGRKLSEGAAAILRCAGISARNLAGGNVAWRDAGLPLVPVAAVPGRTRDGHTLWVTRQRPRVDRVACPWLIRRFVDPGAHFLFVAAGEVPAVAEKFGATPFDVEGVFLGRRGERCSFDTMIEEVALGTGPLLRIAEIVRGAGTNRHDLAPEAAGLLAASLGLSAMYGEDLAQLDAGMALYDALYRWARDAADEAHDRPLPLTAA